MGFLLVFATTILLSGCWCKVIKWIIINHQHFDESKVLWKKTLGTVSFLWFCLFKHLFLPFPLYFTCSPPHIHYFPLTTTKYFVYMLLLYMCWVSAIKICEKNRWNFLVYWIFTIFLPIFSIFQCIPLVLTLINAIKLILLTFTYHTEHVITLE